jgi:hypothetical protein
MSEWQCTTEVWKPVPGAVGYEISNRGRFRSYWRRTGPRGSAFNCWKWSLTKCPKILKQSTSNHGYKMVRLKIEGKQKLRPVHVLLLETFVGPRPPNCVARHLDDNKENNRPTNLVWGTRSQNSQDMVLNNKRKTQKLNCKKVKIIRELLATRTKQLDIAERFGITQSFVSHIRRGRSWHYAK